MATLTLDSSQYENGLKNAQNSSNTAGKKIGGVFGKLKGTIAKAVGVTALVAFGKKAIETGMAFDTAMSQVAATGGKTMEQLKQETGEVDLAWGHFSGNLRDYALEMGRNTKFSATEAAEALNYMALAGYDTQKSMEMLPNVLNLAAAGAMDLAKASDMVTDISSALGLKQAETNKLVDEMAMAASKANASVEQLGSGMLRVGGTAKLMRGGTVELSAALGILADNGTKGAEGGTALRNILMSISGKKFEKTFGAMGVSAYDAEGKLRSLKDIFGDVNKALDGMTDQERTKAITSAFNARDLKNINALLGTEADRWDELTGAIENSEGAAQQMADTQLDNLAGDITLLKSAFEGLQIAISDTGTGPLRKLVQGLTGFTSVLTEAISAGSLSEVAKVFSDAFSNVHKSVMDGLQKASAAVTQYLPQMIGQVLNGLVGFSATVRERAGELATAGLALVENIAMGIIKNIPTIIETVPTIITNFAGVINDNAPKVISTGLTILKALAVGLIKAIPVLVVNIPKILMAIWDVFTAFNWLELGAGAIRSIAKGFHTLEEELPNILRNVATKGWEAFKNIPWGSVGSAVINAIGNGLKALATLPSTLLRRAASLGMKAFTGIAWGNVGRTVVQGIGRGITAAVSLVTTAVRNLVKKIKSYFPFSVGKIFSGWIPKISLTTHKSGDKASTSSSVGRTSFAKAMSQPYMFKRPTEFYAGEAGDEMLYGKSALMHDMREAVSGATTGQNVVIYNTITVEGAESPEDFAERLVRKMKLDMRAI